MRVTDTIRIPLVREGAPGEDTVSLEPSTAIVAFSEDTTSVQVTFRAYQGTTQIYVGNIWGSGDLPEGVTPYGQRGSDNLSYVYTFTRTDPSIDIDAQVDFTANISGGTLTGSVERTRTLHFLSIKPGDDGEGAYYLKPDKDTVVFTPESNTAQVTFTAYCGSEKINGRDPYVRADTRLDGVSYSFGSVSGGTFTMTIARTDDTVQVNGTMVVCLEVDLPDDDTMDISGSVAVLTNDGTPDAQLSTDVVSFKESGSQFVYVTGTRGGMQVSLSESQVSVSPSSGAVWDVTKAQVGQRVELEVAYSGGAAKAAVDEEVTVTTTIGGVDIVKTFRIQTNFDGDPGKDGDPGEDAVYYELDATGNTSVYKAIAGAFAPASIEFSGYKVTGTNRAAVSGDFTLYYHGVDDSTTAAWRQIDFSNANSFALDFARALSDYNLRGGFPTEFRMQWVPDDDAATRIERVIPISNSYAIRGPQRWEDLDNGYDFQSGQIGEIYLDVVIHEINGGDNYYYCIKSHTKGSDKEPGTNEDTPGHSEYWQQMNKLDSVATSLLLADYAKVANLYVDDLFMVGQQTCIWLNPDNDGMKINPVSVLNGNTDRASQSAQDAAWNNPLVEFSAADLPDVDTIYGKDANGNATLTAPSSYYTGTGLGVENYSGSGWGKADPGVLDSIRLGTLTEGAMVRVASSFPSGGALSVTMTEGALSGDAALAPKSYFSTVKCELRLSNSTSAEGTYVSFEAVYAFCYADEEDIVQPGSERTVPFKGFDTTFLAPFSGEAYLQLYLASGDVRCDSNGATASVRFSGGVIATISSVTEQYVARYVGQGAFIGLASDTYARFALIPGQSRHTLLAEGNGIDISGDGTMQLTEQKASETHKVPPGGTLLTAWVSLSGGSIQANYWTWDGASISMRRADTGSYAFSIPSMWETKLRGDATLNASHFAINVTAIQQGTAGFTANVWNADKGEVQVVLRNADGDLQDGASYLTVHYIGDGQSIG